MLINERPVKILILGEAKITHTQRWIAHFQNAGWTVRALSFDPIPQGVECESLGPTVLPRAIHVLLTASRVRSIVETFRPDITSALFLPDYGWLATLAGAKPLIVSAWGSDVLIAPKKSAWNRKRISRVVRNADHLIGDAEVLRDGMLALGADNARISTIPLGVSDELLAIGANRRIESHSPITVFHARRLEPVYRPGTFIKAAALVAKSDPGRYRFVMAGDGSMRPAMNRLIGALSLGDAVELREWMSPEELAHQLASTDIYVACPEVDATSVSLLEAMATGCYPIVTDLPANREWIDSDTNGTLFPVGDDQSLARAIIAAAQDPQRRETARVLNTERIRRHALWRSNMSKVEDIIADVLTRKHKLSL